MAYDINYGSVALLLHGNGANGSTTFTDSSPTPKTVTGFGSAQISTTQSKFGGASILFSGSSYLTAPANAAYDFGAGDFTVEASVYLTGSLTEYRPIVGCDNIGATRGWLLLADSDISGKFGFSSFVGGLAISVSSTSPAPLNTWVHVAVSRSGGSLRMFVDGVLNATTAISGSVQNAAQPLSVGALWSAGAVHPSTGKFIGNLDEVRITKGVARYTADFTPPTEAFLDRSSESANAQLYAPSATAISYGGANAKLVSPLPALMSEYLRHADVAVTAPSPTFYAGGHDSTGENAFAGTAPMASLVFAGGATARLTAPSPTLVITGTATVFGAAALTAPAALVDASGTVGGTASASLRAPVGELVGYFGGVISVTTTDRPTLVASGTAGAIGSATLATPMASVIGYSGAVCSITLTDGYTLQASGSGGGVGVATLNCPLFELTASATRQTSGTANLLAPSPRMGATAQAWLISPGATLTAIGTAVVTVAYEAYNVNLKHKVRMQGDPSTVDEMTRYTNFPFDRIVRYQNSYFGVAADGLYLLEGTTDDGAAIACALETHVDDFNVPEKKTIVSAHIGGRFGPTATVTLHVGETGETAYPYTTPRGQLAQNHREKFGRGIKDRYFGLKVETSGALEIDQLEFEINKLTRRI